MHVSSIINLKEKLTENGACKEQTQFLKLHRALISALINRHKIQLDVLQVSGLVFHSSFCSG